MATLLAFVAAAGCRAVAGYARDRAADAADVLTFEASLGYGLAADAKATEWAHVGLGYLPQP